MESSETDAKVEIIPRCEDIPDDPPAGNYVVVDVMYFSTTVVELLDNGAEYVHVAEEKEATLDYRREFPAAKIGGHRTPE
ncbi:MAG: 2-phosphosulfolactate phosphatase, partial [Halobacteria archaeon]|nr:2-phosphosulfolactate phosphatase [Halobacteria archaeon]